MKNQKLLIKHFSVVAAAVLLCFMFSCVHRNKTKVDVRGIYGNPRPLWEKGYDLRDLGVNSIFVHSGSINSAMMERARSEDLNVYAEFATLNGKNYVEEHPEAWAINEKGERVEAASWFMGVCPTEPGFRQYRLDILRDLISKYDLDGIWMDYVHWHAQFEEPEPILPETCFCDHCLQAFSTAKNISLPDGSTIEKSEWILTNHDDSWRKWRCEVIYDWTKEFRSVIKNHNPEMLLGLYHCPWDDEEFNAARIYNLGLDYDLLKNTIDVFSPMVYHGRMGRPPEWVKENIEWFCKRVDIQEGKFPKVWPIVQAHDDPEIITAMDFEKVLNGGLSGAASGVMMFTTNAIAESDSKTKVMKDLYLQLKEDER